MALAFVGLVACTKAESPTAKPEPSSSAASPPRPVDTGAWASDFPKTWTDPRVVEAIAQSCAFVPDRTDRQHHDIAPPNRFLCDVGYAQSCDPETCLLEFDCAGKCMSTCTSCGATCTTSCETCKAGCHDAECRKTCAASCAECKEGCANALDHCSTADCGKEHAACTKTMNAKWTANGCGPKCTRYKACDEVCDKKPADDYDACIVKCDAALAPGLRECVSKCPAGRATRGRDACIAQCYQAAPCSPFACSGHTSIE